MSRAARLLAWAGCGALPAAVLAAGALQTGAKTPWAALGLAVAAGAAAAAPAPKAAGLSALALGAVLSAALVRAAGAWPALAAAAAACAAGLALSRREPGPQGGDGAAWPAAPAAAALVAWARLLGLLAFDDLSVVAGLTAAVSAAFAAAPLLAAVPRALLPALAAAAGLAGLALLRVIGLNAGEPERLQVPAAGLGDALFLGGQGLALAALWLAPSAAAGFGRRGALWAAAGAAAGALACARFGPEAALLAACAAQAAAGLAGAARLRRQWPVGSKLAAAAVAACALGAWPARALTRDVWLNRLNAAYPGGSYLAFADDGSAARAAYRFASGAVVLLEDGVASHVPPQSARRHLQAALLAHPSPKTVLLASPWTPVAPLAPYEAAAEVALPGRANEALRAALGAGPAAAASRDLRRLARGRPGRFDLIFAWSQPATPLRREQTVEAVRELKAALADGGVLALQLPPGTARASASLRAAGEAAFAHSTGLELAQGALALFSDRPIMLKARVPLAVMAEEPEFAAEAAGLRTRPLGELVPDGQPLTDRRAWAPVAAPRNWYNP